MSDLIKTLKSSETGDNVYPNIKEDNIPSGAVKTAKLDDESVTTDKLGTMAVTTAKIDTGAVTTAKINDSAVTTIKLNDGAVTTAKISDGAVTSAKIGSSAVTNAKINDGAVSYDKLATALKNLIDGKASQTDLETLQTAVNGKQDKIDSTHKLDADLVDDSTSTNKFTNASNLSKLSGIESGAEVNVIESVSVNGTPVTPDANRNVNIVVSGGSLYLHKLRISIEGNTNTRDFILSFYSNDSTPITINNLSTYKNYIANCGMLTYDDIDFIDILNDNSTICSISSYLTSLFEDSGEWYIYFYITYQDNATKQIYCTEIDNTTISSLTDNITQIL